MKKKLIVEKKMPRLLTDEDAEKFLDQDLSPYLHKGNFSSITFEFEPKTTKINLRVTPSLLASIKKKAKRVSMPYQRYIRHVLERELNAE
jgi:predicted DNA binding CopG/RHH family protein